jgi:hypothetical protein
MQWHEINTALLLLMCHSCAAGEEFCSRTLLCKKADASIIVNVK